LDIIELVSIQTFTAGGENASSIQTPVTTNRELVLNFTAKSGESILISGYRSRRQEADSESSGLLWGLLGGSKSHSDNYTEVLILITPKIVSPNL
jgi:type II secretory pathway component GspD/PulD (secretin)